MSAIYFHSPSGQAAVRGSERAWFGSLINKIGIGLLELDWNAELIMSALPNRDLTMFDRMAHANMIRTSIAVGDESFAIGVDRYEAFAMLLNSAMAYGNDALKFAARIHGSCEIHAWVDGPNRDFLADVIEFSPATVIRPNAGWESVIELLRARDDEPVVTSYSVCDSFPNPYVLDVEMTDEQYDAWHDIPTAEKWEQGMTWLRAQNGGLEMHPDRWDDHRFLHGIDSLQLIDMLRAAKTANQSQHALILGKDD